MKHKQHTKPKERRNQMSKIIQFPTKEQTISNGYKNLVALFEVCSSKEGCDFYLSTAEDLFKTGKITESELYTLRRIGRQKRLKFA